MKTKSKTLTPYQLQTFKEEYPHTKNDTLATKYGMTYFQVYRLGKKLRLSKSKVKRKIVSPEKSCRICHETKPIRDYPRNSAMADGHRSECHSCTSLYNKNYFQEKTTPFNPIIDKIRPHAC